MEPYVGIAVFELSKSETATQEAKSFFREDFYIVYAQNDDEAQRKVEALAHEQESEPGDMNPLVTLRHIVDVAPALYGLSLIHISEPTRPVCSSRMPSSA